MSAQEILKAKELVGRDREDLRAMVLDLQRKLWEARFSNYAGQLKDTHTISRLRRNIARVQGVIRAQELNRTGVGEV